MKSTYFFLTSVGQIPYFSYLYKDYKKKPVVIITYLLEVRRFLYKYFEYDNIRVIYIAPDEVKPYSLKNPLENLFIIFKRHKLYRKYFANVKEADIYFFSTYYLFTLYFIKRLSDENNIYYYPATNYKQNEKLTNITLIDKLNFLTVLFLYQIKVKFVSFNKRYFFVSQRYFDKYQIKIIKEININKSFQSDKLTDIIKHKKVLILPAYVPHIIEEESLKDVWDYILDKLEQIYTPDDLVYKNHPKNKFENFCAFKNVDEIDSFIPSEFIFNYNFDFVITLYSNALKTAVQYSKSPIINIMKLFSYINKNEKDAIFSSLSEIHNEFYHCPQNLNELNQIILKYRSITK